MIRNLSTRKIWLSTRDYLMIVFGATLYAAAFCGLILPNKVVIGGVTGVGTLVFFLTGLPVAVTQYAINLALLAFAWKPLGRRFVLKTIFGATCLSAAMGVFQPLLTHYFPDGLVAGQPFMCILIGAFLCGLSLGLIFVHNGSTGGTDIVAAMVAKKTTISIGRTMLYVDFCIISSSFFLFHNIDTVVFGLVFLFVQSYVCDQIINSNRQAVQFTIISPYWQKIADTINDVAHRGCTVINGTGWYSKHDVKMLSVVCRIQESVLIFRITQSVDPDAFILQCHVHGVYGRGFDALKIKRKSLEETVAEARANDTRGAALAAEAAAEAAATASPKHLERNVNRKVNAAPGGGHPTALQ